MTSGIVLFCFGKPAYYKMAFNMALSIRVTSPGIDICLITDGQKLLPEFSRLINWTRLIDPADIVTDGKPDPGKLKTSVYKYLPYDHNIVLDVDGCAQQDLNALMTSCIADGRYYLTQYVDKLVWAEQSELKQYYNLERDIPAVNSSFQYIRKCPEAAIFFDRVQSYYEHKFPSLKSKWGGTYPDELAIDLTLSMMDLSADTYPAPVFLSRQYATVAQMKVCPILGCYGGNHYTHPSVTDYYDKLISFYSQKILSEPQRYKWHRLSADKHANKK